MCRCSVASYHFTPPQSIHFCSTSPLQGTSPFSSRTVPLTRSLRVCAIATRSLTPNIRYPFLCWARYLSPTLSRLTGSTIRTVREQAWGGPFQIAPSSFTNCDNRAFLTIHPFPRHRWLCSNSSKRSSGVRACRDGKQQAGISVQTDAQALDRLALISQFSAYFYLGTSHGTKGEHPPDELELSHR